MRSYGAKIYSVLSYKLLFLGRRCLIKKITQTAMININIVFQRTAADHFPQSSFQTSNVLRFMERRVNLVGDYVSYCSLACTLYESINK